MQKIKHIFCATDLSKASRSLISWGVEFCLKFDASFLVFHSIAPPRGSVSRQIEFERGGEKEEKIKEAREKIIKIMAQFDIKWDLVVAYGDPVLEAVKVAEKTKPDIIIAASHGLSRFQQFFIGSVVGRMAQLFSQPLLVIPPGSTILDKSRPKLQFDNITVACSLLTSDSELKNYALIFSEKFNSKVCLVHVMESPVNEEIVEITSAPYDETQRCLEEKLSLKLKNLMPGKIVILRGIPGEELALHAKSYETNLIIAGVDDRSGMIITTTTAALLHNLPCAVLTVPVKSSE
ncbi:MAG: hypothetical protein DRH34_10790 [Deltaproteobacteria bacterium]|nr:MAG: hypothetical protein DRH34_10790 [Deltaproteobacteria bacterium]RLC25752.1 MAG: hypothetical protein DRH93_01005 [Deltaproteobacteria bacterium]